MERVRHGSGPTKHAVRSAMQRSKASLTSLSRVPGPNPKRMAGWRERATVEDIKTGPTEERSTVLIDSERPMVVVFRKYTRLRLDDRLHAGQPSIPHLTRSALQPMTSEAAHLASAGCGGRRAQAAEAQAVSHRVLPHRNFRGSDRRGQ
ncbi:MAG: hypothetical protein ACK4FR_14180, partial [Tabrizicola sp.]